MNGSEFLAHLVGLMSDEFTSNEKTILVKRLLSKFSSRNYLQWKFDESAVDVSNAEIQLVLSGVERLNQGEPIQYIEEEVSFIGVNLLVGKGVLIPRPETEELVNWVFKDTTWDRSFRCIDLCSGSGCIALGLKHANPEIEMTALECDKDAINILQKNITKTGLTIHFLEADIFQWQTNSQLTNYDIVISNPPYIKLSEKLLMEKNVLAYEPEIALFADEHDPLIFYKTIIELANVHLVENGKIYFECNPLTIDELYDLAQANHYKALIQKDMFGEKRFLKLTKSFI